MGRRAGADFSAGDWPEPIWKWYRPGRITLWIGVVAVAAAVVVNHGRLREGAARPGLAGGREAEAREVEYRRDGLWVARDQRPYTGVIVERHPSGALRSRKHVVDGRLEGVAEGWYPEGGLQIREYYEAGKAHGPQRTWHPGGRLMSETPMVRGRPQGVERRWSEEGTLVVERRMGDPEWASHRLAR